MAPQPGLDVRERDVKLGRDESARKRRVGVAVDERPVGSPVEGDGLDAGEQAKLANPEVKLVYVTMIPDPELAAEAFRRGASAYLLKTSAIPELIIAVKEALNGRLYISPQVTKDALSEFLRSHKRDYGSKSLTPRQREVLQLLAEGRSMKEAASVLNLTTRTVAFHKYRIMATLRLNTNSELIQYAIRHFIIPG